jgi:hypothetical protein
MDSNFWFLPGRRWAGSEHFLKDACGEAARLGVEPLHYTAGLETSSIAAAASVWFRAAGHLAGPIPRGLPMPQVVGIDKARSGGWNTRQGSRAECEAKQFLWR